MKILVCVKQVVDSSVALDIDAATNDIGYDDVAWMPNPPDLAALRIAASIRARLVDAQVFALSVGPERVASALRKSVALGADQAVRVAPRPGNSIESWAVVPLLAAAARHLGCSLVLCGNQAVDTLSGQTGIALSVALDWPLVTSVTQVASAEGKGPLVLRRRADAGRREVVQVDPPALLTCEPDDTELPYPSLPLHMKGLAATIAVLTPEDIGVNCLALPHSTGLKAVGISPPKPRPKRIFTPDSHLSAADRIKQIMSGGLAQRQSDVLEGSSREAAIALVNELRKRKLL